MKSSLSFSLAPAAGFPALTVARDGGVDISSGVNIKFVFGGGAYISQRPPLQAFGNAGDPWYRPPIDDYPLMHGHYNGKQRMRKVLNVADFQQIADDGFECVRFFVDPMIFGCNNTTFVLNPSSAAYPFGMGALVETINEATSVGLDVVLLLAPTAISTASFEDFYDLVNGTSTTPNALPGPPRKELAFRPTAGYTPTGLDPLRLFWTSFATQLKFEFDEGRLEPEAWDIIVFEIMSEGHVDFTPPNLGLGGDSTAVFNDKNSNSGENWRAVHLNAINGILSVHTEANIIATTYDSFPEAYVLQADLPDYPIFTSELQVNQRLVHFASYSSSELQGQPSLLAYGCNAYAPFRYTHWSGTGVDPNHRLERDSLADPNGADPENVGIPAYGGQYSPLNGHVKGATKWLVDWRFNCDGPPMWLAEFGPYNRYRSRFALPVEDPNLVVPRPPICPGPALFKAQHIYDYRNAAEAHGIWWNAYEYLGGWALYEGRLEYEEVYQFNQRDPGSPRFIIPVFPDGLFGASRP